jgi:hypothetical protein
MLDSGDPDGAEFFASLNVADETLLVCRPDGEVDPSSERAVRPGDEPRLFLNERSSGLSRS